jgi:phage-related protein
MGFSNAEVLVNFVGNTENLDKKTKEAGQTIKGFGKSVGGILGALGTLTLATSGLILAETLKGIKKMVQASVEAYSNFEQLEGGLVSLFGEGSAEMNRILEDSQKAYKNLTMSQNDYLTSFQSAYPLVNAGLNSNKDAIEYTNKVLQLSSDLFNTYGGSIDYYQNAINWALKGSFVYLDNLNIGIKGTQEGFIEAANNAGILGRNISNVNELTSDEIIDVIQHYAEQYGVWGKTSEEASSTIIGSMNMVKATWDNFILGLSQKDADLNGLVDKVISSVETFLNNVIPVVIRAVESIANILPSIVEKLAEKIPQLLESLLPPIIDALLKLIKSLAKNLPEIIKILGDAIIDAAMGLLDLLPDIIDAIMGGAVALIEVLADAMPTLLPKLVQAIIDGVLKIVEYVPEVIQAAIDLLMGIVEALPTIIVALVDALPEIITTIVDVLIESIPILIEGAIQLLMALIEAIPIIILKLGEKIPEIIIAIIEGLAKGNDKLKDAGSTILNKVVEGIGSILGKVWDVGKNIVSGLWNGIVGAKDWIVNKVKGLAKSILNGMKSALGIHSPSTEFAILGKFSVLGYTEALDKMKGQVQDTIDSVFNLQPEVSSAMSSTYSPQTNVIVNNNMEIDPLGQVVNKIKTFSGGAKNDYNWGATI